MLEEGHVEWGHDMLELALKVKCAAVEWEHVPAEWQQLQGLVKLT